MGFLNKVVLSYALDCVVLLILVVAAGFLTYAPPTRRAFSITDPEIAFPYYRDTISITAVFLIAVVAPAVIIVGLSLVLPVRAEGTGADPGAASPPRKWRRKLWELFAAFLGFAFAVIVAFLVTQIFKNTIGKLRPDFLHRCDPDLAQFRNYTLGGFSSEFLESSSELVAWQICRSRNGTGVGAAELDDGFRSFPSGHSSVSFAGLFYLTLFLAAKFRVTVPTMRYPDGGPAMTPPATGGPLYLLVTAAAPTVVAAYIGSTRYTDYKHFGSDVLLSSAGGALFAWLGFRWYHMPIARGGGQTCGARSAHGAFYVDSSEGKAGGAGAGPESFVRIGENSESGRWQNTSRPGTAARTAGHAHRAMGTGASDEVELRPYSQRQ